jgi:hypothetical protein
LTYQGIKTLRTAIGNAIDNPTDVMKSAQPSLRRLYGALSADLQDSVMTSGGKSAVDAFKSASDLATETAATRQALEKITGVSTTTNGGEAIFQKLMNYASNGKGADIERLKLAQKTLPPEVWDKVGQGAVDTLSRDAKNNINMDAFFSNYNKLSKEGKVSLFGSSASNPALLSQLDDLAIIGSRIDRLKSISRPETGSKIGGTLGELLSFINFPVATIVGGTAGRKFSSLMAEPATAKSVVRWANNYEHFLRSPSQATANDLGNATKDTATMVGGEYGAPTYDDMIEGVLKMSAAAEGANYLYNWYKGDQEQRQLGQKPSGSNEFVGSTRGDAFAGQPQANGGRIERARGGSVIDRKADALINETIRNKKLHSDETEHMLSMPDDAIVQALKVAKQVAA